MRCEYRRATSPKMLQPSHFGAGNSLEYRTCEHLSGRNSMNSPSATVARAQYQVVSSGLGRWGARAQGGEKGPPSVPYACRRVFFCGFAGESALGTLFPAADFASSFGNFSVDPNSTSRNSRPKLLARISAFFWSHGISPIYDWYR